MGYIAQCPYALGAYKLSSGGHDLVNFKTPVVCVLTILYSWDTAIAQCPYALGAYKLSSGGHDPVNLKPGRYAYLLTILTILTYHTCPYAHTQCPDGNIHTVWESYCM